MKHVHVDSTLSSGIGIERQGGVSRRSFVNRGRLPIELQTVILSERWVKHMGEVNDMVLISMMMMMYYNNTLLWGDVYAWCMLVGASLTSEVNSHCSPNVGCFTPIGCIVLIRYAIGLNRPVIGRM